MRLLRRFKGSNSTMVQSNILPECHSNLTRKILICSHLNAGFPQLLGIQRSLPPLGEDGFRLLEHALFH